MPNKATQYAKGIVSNNKQNFRRLAGWYKAMHGLDQAAIATAPIPVVGDLVGLAADIRTFKEEPSWANAGWLAAGTVIPFVGGKAVKDGVKAISESGEVVDATQDFNRVNYQVEKERARIRELNNIDNMLEEDKVLFSTFQGKRLKKQIENFLEKENISLRDYYDYPNRELGSDIYITDQETRHALMKKREFLASVKYYKSLGLDITEEEIDKILNLNTYEEIRDLQDTITDRLYAPPPMSQAEINVKKMEDELKAELSAREMRKKAREKRPSFQEKYDFNTGLRGIQAKRLEEYSARMLEQDRQLKNSPYGEQLFKQRDKMLEELGIDLQDLNKEAMKSGISEQLGLYLEKKEALVKLQQSPISDEIAKAILDAENLFDLREITNPGLNRQ